MSSSENVSSSSIRPNEPSSRGNTLRMYSIRDILLLLLAPYLTKDTTHMLSHPRLAIGVVSQPQLVVGTVSRPPAVARSAQADRNPLLARLSNPGKQTKR